MTATNEANIQRMLNLQIARTYLVASDPEMVKRTWQTCLDEIIGTKRGSTLPGRRRSLDSRDAL